MIRRIIQIDEEKCNGCGACAAACHESAIGMVDGKAKLLRDDYCDGLGDCLPACPTGAITFVEREAAAYDEAAVLANQKKATKSQSQLQQWPVQIKLVPTNAPYFDGAKLLIAADCTAYAYNAETSTDGSARFSDPGMPTEYNLAIRALSGCKYFRLNLTWRGCIL